MPTTPTSLPAPERPVALDHLELHYEEYGVGPPLVLLHGFGGGAPNWYPFTAPLAACYRLLVVELPGHGHSPTPAHPFTHQQAAQHVFHFLDKGWRTARRWA